MTKSASRRPATATSSPDGRAQSRRFGTPFAGASDLADWTSGPTVGIAASATGYWTVEGAPIVNHMDAFLTCTRSHESSHTAPAFDNGYQAVNPSGTYFGAYQFDLRTSERRRGSGRSSRPHRGEPGVRERRRPRGPPGDDPVPRNTAAAPWMGRCSGSVVTPVVPSDPEKPGSGGTATTSAQVPVGST